MKDLITPGDTASDAEMLDRVAREIASQLASRMEEFYPQAVDLCGERMLFNIKTWARSEVHRWFSERDPSVADTTMDARLRAAAAHRRHIKRLRTLAGTVQPGDALDPILAVMDASREQAKLDYRAGGPVVEAD